MRRLPKPLYLVITAGLTLFALGVLGVVITYLYVAPSLPSVAVLKDIRLQVPLRVYTRDGRLLAQFGEKRRIPLSFEQIPKNMVNAFVAAEDEHFWEHPGIDVEGVLRAGIHYVLTGSRSQGGGTITMQVARDFFLTKRKIWSRKIREAFLALKIERELSKQDILTLYINKIYLGSRAYGAGAAAQVYYGTDVDHLTLAQIAMIAGLPQAPSAANPLVNPKRALSRRGYVLGRMLADGYINQQQYDQAMAAPLTASYHEPTAAVQAPYLAEMVRNYMVSKYGDDAYTAGYSVVTTIDSRLQPKAVAAVRSGLLAYDRRHGWRGPIAQVKLPEAAGEAEFKQAVVNRDHVGGLIPAVVTAVQDQSAELYADGVGPVTLAWAGLKWARKFISVDAAGAFPKTAADILKRGDVVYLSQDDAGNWNLAQVPTAQSALVSLDPFDGAVVALVGGFDFDVSKFNRATQAHRQPGSSFKPFYYSAALEDGFTPASVINNAPVVVKDPALGAWRPGNYEGDFSGPTRLRTALVHSLNLVSIRVLQQIGIDYTLNYISKFGFKPDEMPHNLTMALGSASLSPLEMARGYSVFANHGFRVTPYYIQRIEDGSGNTLYQADPKLACESCSVDTKGATQMLVNTSDSKPATMPEFAPQVISPQNDWLMTSMMQDVIRHGTGRLASQLGRDDLAGKTGTTNDFTDAWFDGFNNDIVTVVWVGNDQPSQSLGSGEQGALAALPIWMNFMGAALTNVPQPADPYPEPPGLVRARIDPKTGLLVSASDPGSIWEYFETGHLPKKAPKKTQSGGSDIF